MILSIAGNSLVLAMYDYSDANNQSLWNQRLDNADQYFTIFYIIEAALKIIAFGFIVHKKSYLRDPWNVIDFVVVVIGIISLVPNFPNLKSLRIFRIFRPLRSINAVPPMKRLVSTLIMSMPQMGYLVSFLLFFIAVFAILGI
jgi:voltage-dependent calcium channel L type alpha-1D